MKNVWNKNIFFFSKIFFCEYLIFFSSIVREKKNHLSIAKLKYVPKSGHF